MRPPGRMAGISSRQICRTPASSTTQTPTCSARAPSSARLAAASAPSSLKGARASARRAHTTRGNPDAAMRRAIGPPWLPKPMKPTRALVMALSCGHAAVDVDASAVIAPSRIGGEKHDYVGHVVDLDQPALPRIALDQRVVDAFGHLEIVGDVGR